MYPKLSGALGLNLLGLTLGLGKVAWACNDGDTRACEISHSKSGLQVCVQHEWSGCAGAGGGTTAPTVQCPSNRSIVYISGLGDQQERDRQRACFVSSIQTANTIVRLGPDVDFNFSQALNAQKQTVELFEYPINLGSCVVIEGVSGVFGPTPAPCPKTLPGRGIEPGESRPPSAMLKGQPIDTRNHDSLRVQSGPPERSPPREPGPARTSRSLGPVLRFGDHSKSSIPDSTAFLQIGCDDGYNGNGDKVRGFQLFGPTFEDQTKSGYAGIRVQSCTDAEISNMEIAGWGGEAVDVATQNAPSAWPTPLRVIIHDNYIHHNLHTENNGHSAGYGVATEAGAFSHIYSNTFDFNNHDVMADGKAGGYAADHNLILKGGGLHSTGYFAQYMHVFDVHGDQQSCWPHGDWTCGHAPPFYMEENTFQYTNSDDIGIRGTVRQPAYIQDNVFARSNKRSSLDLYDDTDIHVDNNTFDVDTFGQYAVCDFDGDGVDDLFLTTGVTWWFSSGGQFPWTFMRADVNRTDKLVLGDFDGDRRCDVLEEVPQQSGVWRIARGGVSPFEPLAKDSSGKPLNFGHPLSEVRFGQFDPAMQDRRPGLVLPMTHAFWRDPQGAWFVTSLKHVAWLYIGGSSFPLSALRFGDFDGDGVTDVLAVEQGHWSISKAGRGQWTPLNATLNTAVQTLIVQNMDADDNIDDLLYVACENGPAPVTPPAPGLLPLPPAPALIQTTITWWRSKNGSAPWTVWKKYTWTCAQSIAIGGQQCGASFAGRFAAIPGNHVRPVDPKRSGAGTLTIDLARLGHFYNPMELLNGRPAEWTSDSYFRY